MPPHSLPCQSITSLHCAATNLALTEYLACRHRVGQVDYLRLAKSGSPKGIEHTAIFLIQAAAVALRSIAEAGSAKEKQAAAAQAVDDAKRAAEAAQQVLAQTM